MALLRFEVALVSADGALVDFMAEVFQLSRQEPQQAGVGVLHRLESPGALFKVMVPRDRPGRPAPVQPHYGATGLRYLTMFVDDLDDVASRAGARGATTVAGPMELRPGVRLVILEHPEGVTIEVIEQKEGA